MASMGQISMIQDMLSHNAANSPNSPMIVDDKTTTTYLEVEKLSNGLAKLLKGSGACPKDNIAFFMDKSANSFISMFGILKADCTYIPLDSKLPKPRAQYILEDSQAKLILCDSKNLKTVEGLVKEMNSSAQVVLIDKKLAPSDKVQEYQNTPKDLAYIIYTSGSTGKPKGVMIKHENIIDYASWTANYFNVTQADHISSHAGLHFDLSVFDIYTAFMAGASLHIVPPAVSMFPIKFMDFVEDHKITIWCSVPTFLTYIAKSGVLKPERLKSLRVVTFCGEVMPTVTANTWKTVYPNLKFTNQYGPTETTCASLYFDIEKAPQDLSTPVPIGKVIPGTTAISLTEGGQEAKEGEIGELHIGGAGNGVGYWRQPEKTKSVFIQSPIDGADLYATGDLVKKSSDGNYHFVSRKDDQIKFMGYRIELGEIEVALNSLDAIKSSAVIAISNKKVEGHMIIGFVVLKQEIPIAQIQNELKKLIPVYMVPKKIEIMDDLPTNPNGKIDRLKLKEMANGN